jgi:hypothetical protein
MRSPVDSSPELSSAPLEHADTLHMPSEPRTPEGELEGPSSRPTLSDSPIAFERAFFQEGDEGRYPGGPATLVPVAMDDELDDLEPAVEAPAPDPRQIARRNRFARAVALFVGALGAVTLVALFRPAASAPEVTAAERDTTGARPAPAQRAQPAPAQRAQPAPAQRSQPAPAQRAETAEPAPQRAHPTATTAEPARAPIRRPGSAARRAQAEPAEAPPLARSLPPAPVPSGPPPTAAFPPTS